MSIAPVERFPPARSGPSENLIEGAGNPQARPAAGVTKGEIQSVPGTTLKEENSGAKKISQTGELPEDVVELHQDPETKGRIIIDYLDQEKNVVLQVPSAEELSVERGIAREFQAAAKLRESQDTAAAGSQGEKTHGD